MLVHFYYPLDFRVEGNGLDRISQRDVLVPAVLDLRKDLIVIKVMTMKSVDWTPLFGSSVKKAVSAVHPDRIRDEILRLIFIPEDPLVGSQIDFTTQARSVLKRQEVETFSGTYLKVSGGEPRLVTSHKTVGSRTRLGLRTAASTDFEALVSAQTITSAEIFFAGDALNLMKDTKMVLRPVAGEVILTTMIEAGDLDAFLEYCAS